LSSIAVKLLYALLTVSQWDVCNFQTHSSPTITCKTIEIKRSTHSPNNSFSQANNLIHHFHASPFTPQPKSYIWTTVTILFSANSYNLLELTFKENPSNHRSLQNRVEDPSSTFQPILSSNQPPSTNPTPFSMFLLKKLSLLFYSPPNRSASSLKTQSTPFLTLD